jgi:hypothetical protein
VPTVTEGKVEAVIASGVGATTRVTVADAAWMGLLLSLTDAVKVEVPLVAGVPKITPEDDRLSPAGTLPDVIVHL